LALKGFFPIEELKTLNQPYTNLPSHCDMNKTSGIDITTGSLGQGLSVAAGVALGYKLKEIDNYIYCIVGDGELQEGQNWEAIMLAAQQKLDNLVLFVDSNKVQLDGAVHELNNLESYEAKFTGFNWNVLRVDGHDLNAIKNAIEKVKENKERPSVIIVDTVKGKGIVWAEGQFNHHIEVSREAADVAIEAMNVQ
ncbi:MAG: transketolase, partial [Clostridium sp.]